ncbi:MAG: type IV toxin-antitoxin system AbiEi family antitoxin [Bacteroidota bacterium]
MTIPKIDAILYQLQGEAGLNLSLKDDVLWVDQKPFAVKAQQEFKSYHLPQLLTQRQEGKFLIIADHIYANLKTQLRAADIAYVDSAGNAYLKEEGLFVFIDGRKKKIQKENLRHKAFTKTGLKIVFHFLLFPDLLQQNYRRIASQLEVSLDSVSKTIGSLKALGFIVMLDKKRMQLVKPKALLDRWLYQYGDKLKNRLLITKFRYLGDLQQWRDIELQATSQWGGEAGADLLTNHLHPEIWTIYSNENRAELMKNYRLLPDENGNIEVYQAFWNLDNKKHVPSLLMYADLMYNGDPRNIETAQKIYEEHLQYQLGEAEK